VRWNPISSIIMNVFVKDRDRISWMEGILKEKALQWHQARTQQFADLRAQDTWMAY
jgi:hypothetical protein